jgi:hypothetical protein
LGPVEWVGATQDAGAVHVLYGSAGGLQGPGGQGDRRAFDGVAETDLWLIGVRTWGGSDNVVLSYGYATRRDEPRTMFPPACLAR